jgi:hypothetical protein
MTVTFLVLKLDSKQHKVGKKGDEYWLTFKDAKGNTVKFRAEEPDFKDYDYGDVLDLGDVFHQTKLEAA